MIVIRDQNVGRLYKFEGETQDNERYLNVKKAGTAWSEETSSDDVKQPQAAHLADLGAVGVGLLRHSEPPSQAEIARRSWHVDQGVDSFRVQHASFLQESNLLL